MARKGYDVERQYPSKVMGILPEEKPGARWSALWRLSGMSRPTFAKYLNTLVANGYALHENGFYRTNPTRAIFDAEGWRGFAQARKDHLTALESWTLPPESSKSVIASMTDADGLRSYVDAYIGRISVEYIAALNAIVKIPKKAAAREYIDLFLKIEVIPSLHGLAQWIWEQRAKSPVRSLEGYASRLERRAK
jgi:hypothetical protein